MLRYNTSLKPLVLPEYGRNIQQMVDHCLTIEDRSERNLCARSIIRTMATLFPEAKESDSTRRKLWDDLAIMSNFMLDIDWPCEVVTESVLQTRPEKVPYPSSPIRLRHYGRALERMIAKAVAMEPGEERDALVDLLAHQMKKQLAIVDTDGASDERVFKDLAEFSHGEIRLMPGEVQLHEFDIVAPVNTKKRRKK